MTILCLSLLEFPGFSCFSRAASSWRIRVVTSSSSMSGWSLTTCPSSQGSPRDMISVDTLSGTGFFSLTRYSHLCVQLAKNVLLREAAGVHA